MLPSNSFTIYSELTRHLEYKRKTDKTPIAGSNKKAAVEAKKKGKTEMGLKEAAAEAKKKGNTEMGLKEADAEAKKKGKMGMGLKEKGRALVLP